jgi:hypothetical protein
MIIKEFYKTREDGADLYRTYSDANVKIQKVGTNEVYDEAIDPAEYDRQYIETDEPIEKEDLKADLTFGNDATNNDSKETIS